MMSFTQARVVLLEGWLTNALLAATPAVRKHANNVMLSGAIGNRPGRREPTCCQTPPQAAGAADHSPASSTRTITSEPHDRWDARKQREWS